MTGSDDDELLQLEECECAMSFRASEIDSPQMIRTKLYRQITLPFQMRELAVSRNTNNKSLRFKEPVSMREPEQEPRDKFSYQTPIKYDYNYKEALNKSLIPLSERYQLVPSDIGNSEFMDGIDFKSNR